MSTGTIICIRNSNIKQEVLTMTKENKQDFTAIKQDSLPTKLSDIEALIESAKVKGNETQRMYQIAGCAVIQHLAKHKDIRVVRKMLESMPESLRRDSMTKWLDLYAPITVDEEGEIHYNKDGKVQLGLALEKAWWKAKAVTVYKPFDFVAELEKLQAKARKRYDSIDVSQGDDVTAQDLNMLNDMIVQAKQSEFRLVGGSVMTDSVDPLSQAIAA